MEDRKRQAWRTACKPIVRLIIILMASILDVTFIIITLVLWFYRAWPINIEVALLCVAILPIILAITARLTDHLSQ